jgi:PAS domain S-box-containing protein
MRLTIARKLHLGFGLLVVLLVMIGLLLEWGLRRIARHFIEVIMVQEPLKMAASEMEVTTLGTALSVFKYLQTGEALYRARLEKDQMAFARLKTRYDRLARDPQARDLGDRLQQLYKKFQGWGEALMYSRDQQTMLWTTIVRNAQAMDMLLEEYGQTVAAEDPQGMTGPFSVVRLQAYLAELESHLWRHLWQPHAAHQTRIFDQLDEVQQQLTRFATVPFSTAAARRMQHLTSLFEQFRSAIHEVLALHVSQQQELTKFLALRADMDDILGNRIHAFTSHNLRVAEQDAQRTVQQVHLWFLVLFAVSLVAGGGVAVLLGRGIHRAVRTLVQGAEAVGRGGLAHRIPIPAQDELGEVARAFNHMVEKRQQAEAGLQEAKAELESRVVERTAALAQANTALQHELAERQRVEQALRASEEGYRDLFENASDIVYSADLQGHILAANLAAETVSGYTREELLHMRLRDLIAPEDREYSHQMLTKKLADRQPTRYEITIVAKDGRRILLEINSRLVLQNEQPVAIQGIARDVSERKRLEGQLRQQEKLAAIGTLAGGIAHDFNNILTAILGYTDLALREIPPEALSADRLHKVQAAGQRARDLVRQILAFSRQSDAERQPVLLRTIVQEALTLLRASLPTTIEIRSSIATDVSPVLANPTQIHQILMNLCVNAEHAMHDTGGLLEVRLDSVLVEADFATVHPPLQPGVHARLTIRDTGRGMPPDVVVRIFEPFYTTKDVGQGTGMGLSVVHGIVISHGGAITVASTPGQGTTFEVYLPRHTEPADHHPASEEPLPGGQARLLFVDDEVTLSRLGQELLTQLGYDVVACTSSLEALAIFRATPHRFDLVITDQTMPYLTGDALARELRHLRSDIPIILCTGFSQAMMAEKIQAQGIDLLLMKPFIPRDLGLAVQKVLAARSAPA